ncbi:hypothetical protein [Streptomyces formicae]|uniref:Uncharacterized protein n=1 Tax=Streptomyces formicae TaxID=1616117 RepID=A0ABY3WND4_9ACTN|nr:hypothetical protein [Streptomyces formicae]UNM13185.1 hypothetical protein J4032_18315 [Streptomyces formicae]
MNRISRAPGFTLSIPGTRPASGCLRVQAHRASGPSRLRGPQRASSSPTTGRLLGRFQLPTQSGGSLLSLAQKGLRLPPSSFDPLGAPLSPLMRLLLRGPGFLAGAGELLAALCHGART